MKLTILIDNYVNTRKLKAEQGLSILIAEDKNKILFDCGQSGLVLDNAKVLGIDFNKLTSIVLSHGHYDHTGGLFSVLKHLNKNIDIYAHPSIFDEKYSRQKDFLGFNEIRYIGIPEKICTYEKKGARFLLNKDPVKISDRVYFSGQIKKDSNKDTDRSAENIETSRNSFFKKEDNLFANDPLFDDISIFIDLPKLLLIITGCAHSGILNILRKAEELKAAHKELAIIGGLHLLNTSRYEIDNIIVELKKYNIRLLMPAHCTGIEAFVALENSFGSRCIFGSVGKTLEF